MLEEEKLHEKKRMEGRRLNEDEEDHKATLWYDLEKEMRGTFKYFLKEMMVIELKYQKEGLSWEEITEMRRDIINGRNRRTKTNIN